MDKSRSQSCGMPLGEFTSTDGRVSTNFGTAANGDAVDEYCGFCFKDGEFTQPDLTLIPGLRRWRS